MSYLSQMLILIVKTFFGTVLIYNCNYITYHMNPILFIFCNYFTLNNARYDIVFAIYLMYLISNGCISLYGSILM
jgi:hypothetical protein